MRQRPSTGQLQAIVTLSVHVTVPAQPVLLAVEDRL
jgi:hypothetical protein